MINKINHFLKIIPFLMVFIGAFFKDAFGYTRVYYTASDRLFDHYGRHSLDVLMTQTTDDFLNQSMKSVSMPRDIFWTNPKSNRFFSATTISRYNGIEQKKFLDCRLKLGAHTCGALDRLLWNTANHVFTNNTDFYKLKLMMSYMQKNALYHENLFVAIDNYITDHRLSFDADLIVSVFFSMSYLGYKPSADYITLLNSVANQLRDSLIQSTFLQNQKALGYLKPTDGHSHSTIHTSSLPKTPLELLVMIGVGLSYQQEHISKKFYCEVMDVITTILTYMSTIPEFNSKTMYITSDGFIKQQLFWNLNIYLYSGDADQKIVLTSIDYLSSFFNKKMYRENYVGCLNSGLEQRMRASLISMFKDGKIDFFASSVLVECFRTEIDFISVKDGVITCFEADGEFHFIDDIEKARGASVPHINGQTFLKTVLLGMLSSVVRVSSACTKREYDQRFVQLEKIFGTKRNPTMELIDPEHYPQFFTDVKVVNRAYDALKKGNATDVTFFYGGCLANLVTEARNQFAKQREQSKTYNEKRDYNEKKQRREGRGKNYR